MIFLELLSFIQEITSSMVGQGSTVHSDLIKWASAKIRGQNALHNKINKLENCVTLNFKRSVVSKNMVKIR